MNVSWGYEASLLLRPIMTTTQVPGAIPVEASWVSAYPGGLCEVRRRWLGERRRGEFTPMMGSLCKIKVRRKAAVTHEPTASQVPESTADVSPGEQASSYPRSQACVLQVPLNDWVLLRMGEGQCDVVESCLEGMSIGEVCEFTVSAQNAKTSKATSSDAKENQMEAQDLTQQPECFTLQLHSLTPGLESWQMTPREKWAWVLSHKQWGSQRFGKGDVWGAAECYCRAVRLAITLHSQTQRTPEDDMSEEAEDKNNEEEDEYTETSHDCSIPSEDEYKMIKAELHSNLALCQFKLGQLGKSKDSSIKATELNPKSTKAWYRRGQASMELGELEESRRAFEKTLELQPDSASARAGLKQVNSKLKDLDTKLGKRLSKMFN
ncbi:hypothetical protein DNTS_012381 [Danionella cerebrum]|uniref:Uncharacterized protein n=1 Tax=Danionella cerebrum TaxID=2873325 RepID=A0A553RIB2_9TELE|nr:hypothetical protein DNTS_012381 [Danionella translucida]